MTAVTGIDEVLTNRLRYALGAAYDRAIDHAGAHGGTPPSGPFVLAMYDFTRAPEFTHDDFLDTLLVLRLMAERRIVSQGTPGHDEPIESPRYAVPGRGRHLSPLEITAIKAAEMLLTGLPNIELMLTEQKWPGACASFGGRPARMSVGGQNFLRLGLAGSGYHPKYDQLITDMGLATVHFELIEARYIPVEPVVSETFLLGPLGSWHYPRAEQVEPMGRT